MARIQVMQRRDKQLLLQGLLIHTELSLLVLSNKEVCRLIAQHCRTGNVKDSPRITTAREDRLTAHHARASAIKTVCRVREDLQHTVSTVRRNSLADLTRTAGRMEQPG